MPRIVIRVRMEPELEEFAGHLNPVDRVFMAEKLARWAHQLRVSAKVLAGPPSAGPRKPRRLRASDLVKN